MNLFKHTLIPALLALTAMLSNPVMAVTLIPTNGKTDIALSNEFVGLLVFAGVKPAALGPGTLSKKAIASFPIRTGGIEMPKLEAIHAGGLTLLKGDDRVLLSSFIIDTKVGTPYITGLVTHNGKLLGRAPLFDVNLDKATVVQKGQQLTVGNAGVTLGSFAASTLNSLFDTSAFTNSFPIGTATIKVTST